MHQGAFVYLLASRCHGTLYCGITSSLTRRILQHRAGIFAGFTANYDVKRLVWYEHFQDVRAAIQREKRIKNWRREWKCNLIETTNPHWSDLAVPMGFDQLP